MGPLAAMAKLGGWAVSLFTGDVNKDTRTLVHDTVRGVGTWIDERTLTDEERLKANAEMVARYGEFLDKTLVENTERSRTRRALAIWIIRVEAWLLLSTIPLSLYDQSLAELAYKIATDSPWAWLTLGVGAFFFGTHMLRGTPLKEENA